METLAKLDHLNLDTDTKTQVADLVQKLLNQAQEEIKANELKIQALTMELASWLGLIGRIS